MKKRVMIVEDDSSTREVLAKLVRQVEPEAEIHEFGTIDGVYETAMSKRFDLFLLDIIINPKKAGDITGIQLAQNLRAVQKYRFTPIMFVSSLEDAKLYAYSKLHSFGYIEKPFNISHVKETLSEALSYPEFIKRDVVRFLRRDGILYAVNCSDIVYAESIDHKMHFHKTNGEILIIPYKTIKQTLQDFDSESLIQCNRNVIVNRDYIETVDIANKCIKMKNEDEMISIGGAYQKKVLDEL